MQHPVGIGLSAGARSCAVLVQVIITITFGIKPRNFFAHILQPAVVAMIKAAATSGQAVSTGGTIFADCR